MPWPVGWGTTSCSCWNLRALVDEVVDRCIVRLDRLIALRQDGLGVLYEDVETILLAGDGSGTQWLILTLLESVAAVRFDIAMVDMWATRYLVSLIQDHKLTRGSLSTAVAAPAPFANAFLIDSVDLMIPTNFPAANQGKPTVVEFDTSLDDSQTGCTVTTHAFPGAQHLGINLGSLLGSLLPAFTKTRTATVTSTSPIVDDAPTATVEPSWFRIPVRPQLVVGRKSMSLSTGWPTDSWTPSRVIIDTQTVSIPANSPPFGPSEWNFNASVEAMDCVEIEATAVICIQQTTVSVPVLEVQSMPRRQSEVLSLLTQELFTRSAMVSDCAEVTAGTVRVSAFPGRALVLPPATQYRVASTDLVDGSKSGSFVLLRVAVVTPKCLTPSKSIQEQLEQLLKSPEWLEDLQLTPRDQRLSVEEARLVHYMHDQQPGRREQVRKATRDVMKASDSQQPQSRSRPPPDNIEGKVGQMIVELTNPPQWWENSWIEGSPPRLEWEKQLNDFYLLDTLESEVEKGCTSIVSSLNAQASAGAASTKSKSATDGSEETDKDPFLNLAKLFARFLTLRQMHRGFIGAESEESNRYLSSVVVLKDLVQRCCKADSVEARTRIVSEFISPGYHPEMLRHSLTEAWQHVDEDVSSFMQSVETLVDTRRRRAIEHGGLHSPIDGTLVLDGAITEALKEDLVKALQSLASEARRATETPPTALHLVDPLCTVEPLYQRVPTFSVPRTGSVDRRLAALIVQNLNQGLHRSGNHWVPSEVSVDMEGKVRFLTYISNVFPRAHRGLYEAIEAIATAFVPLFETLITEVGERQRGRGIRDLQGGRAKGELTANAESPLSFSLRGRVVQMVVEIVEVELDETKPSNSGYQWCRHATKQANKASVRDIIATGVYFAAVDNVTHPRIGYRGTDFVGGYVDRCIVFSHEFEHMLGWIQLVDASRSGRVLMVKLHLVDSTILTLTTTTIRPSQREWAVDYTLGDVSRYFHLPTEVNDVIKSMLQWDGVHQPRGSFFGADDSDY